MPLRAPWSHPELEVYIIWEYLDLESGESAQGTSYNSLSVIEGESQDAF